MSKRLVVVSDIHPCSKFGPVPPDWKMTDGSPAHSTETTNEIYEFYLKCVENFGKPDILVCNGDLVDGIQHLNAGREIWSSEAHEQIALATHLLKMWRPKETYVTYGTRYHVESGGVMVERIIAQKLGAKLVGWQIPLKVEGCRCRFSHEISVSTSSWQYRTTSLSRELVLDRLQYGDESSNLLVFSHAHYFAYAGYSQQLGIINPGFQGQTPYGARKTPSITPKMGVVSIDLPTLDFNYLTTDGPRLQAEVP
mgnify:FL=1